MTIENPHQHAGGTFQTRLRQDGIFPIPAKFLNLEALDHGTTGKTTVQSA